MRATTQDLKGFRVQALDQRIGEVEDFYFDDQSWNIRYVVVETGRWLERCPGLIEVDFLKPPHWNAHVLPVGLTLDQVEMGLPVSDKKPVFLQKKEELGRYYRWPKYWGGTDPLFPVPRNIEPVIDWGQSQTSIAEWDRCLGERHNPHLRSCEALLGYSIEAEKEIVGSLLDFVIDDTDWSISYMAVEFRHWLKGKIVYISTKPNRRIRIDWSKSVIALDMTKNEVEYSPAHLISKVGVKLF